VATAAPKERKIEYGAIAGCTPAMVNWLPTTPSRTPNRPPSTDRKTASARNWARTSLRRAPTALRMPISRVRSVTLTSMMFMTPIPPTSSEMAATAPSRVVKTWLVELEADRMVPWLITRKSAFWGLEIR
jgi:hypothetical protein